MHPVKMVSNIDLRVTESSHTIPFTANVPRDVPGFLADACLRAGAVPSDGDGDGVVGDVATVDRHKTIVDAMYQILAQGDETLLTRDKEPRNDAVQSITGFKFNRAEREAAWDEVCLKNGDSE